MSPKTAATGGSAGGGVGKKGRSLTYGAHPSGRGWPTSRRRLAPQEDL